MKHTTRILFPFLAAITLLPNVPALAASRNETVRASYLYTLSGFSGVFPVSWVPLQVDRTRNEVYMIAGFGIRIFNQSGMEVYSFNNNGELGAVADLAVTEDGDIIALSFSEQREEVLRCDYRGERKSAITLQGVPPEFSGLLFTRIAYQNGLIYLASTREMKVVVVDGSGVYQKGYDMLALVGDEAKEQAGETIMSGFTVSPAGDILFTLASAGRICIVAPDGSLRVFGQRGSTPGKVGVPAGVATDASGDYILVADTLRCLVIAYDKANLQFQGEFGGRFGRADGLIAPSGIVVDGKNRLYVSQGANRGVNVYQMSVGG